MSHEVSTLLECIQLIRYRLRGVAAAPGEGTSLPMPRAYFKKPGVRRPRPSLTPTDAAWARRASDFSFAHEGGTQLREVLNTVYHVKVVRRSLDCYSFESYGR